MAVIRIHTEIQQINVDQVVMLEEAPSHHLQKVLRVKVGDAVRLFNGDGNEYIGVVDALEKKCVSIQVDSINAMNNESNISIHLGQGLSKGERMDFVIQKAVELGVTDITPLITERCNVRLDKQRADKRLQHWQKVAISAAEQSGRCVVPRIHPLVGLVEWVESCIGFNVVCNPLAEKKISQFSKLADSKVNVLIGPEGGLTNDEILFAISKSFHDIKMGPRILRTETAALSVITLLQSYFGDL